MTGPELERSDTCLTVVTDPLPLSQHLPAPPSPQELAADFCPLLGDLTSRLCQQQHSGLRLAEQTLVRPRGPLSSFELPRTGQTRTHWSECSVQSQR